MEYSTAVHTNIGRMMARGQLRAGMNYHLIKRAGSRELVLALMQDGDTYRAEIFNEHVFQFHLPEKEGLAKVVVEIMDTSQVPAKVPEEVQQKIVTPLRKTFGI